MFHVPLSKAAQLFRPAEWANPLSPHSISVPASDSLLLLQMGRRPRGPHYKQQIKGLPLIRCQGQRGALPVLAMIQYLLICCAPGWKEISPLTGKIEKEGWGQEKNWIQEQRGNVVRLGEVGGRMKEGEESKYAHGPLECILSFFL